MDLFSLIAIAVALAMDAFAVSLVTGFTLTTVTKRHLFRLAFHFGLFQAGMFAAGWYLGSVVQRLIAASDHWIAFVLLLLVGGNIVRQSLAAKNERSEKSLDPTSGWQLVMLSFATSIDALAVGLSLALIGSSVTTAAFVIGAAASGFTIAGMLMGRSIGQVWGRRVEFAGGLILIAIGLNILFDHTFA